MSCTETYNNYFHCYFFCYSLIKIKVGPILLDTSPPPHPPTPPPPLVTRSFTVLKLHNPDFTFLLQTLEVVRVTTPESWAWLAFLWSGEWGRHRERAWEGREGEIEGVVRRRASPAGVYTWWHPKYGLSEGQRLQKPVNRHPHTKTSRGLPHLAQHEGNLVNTDV